MNPGCKKYIPFTPVSLPDRTWPDKKIEKAPVWCSVDLRDGNQALVTPMNLQEKLEYFKLLVELGFKEIEVGFPSASETEYEILRALIDGHYIPDDVTIQVLVQAREHLIRKTFEAVRGAKNVIIHFYNSTSTLQRKVVFKKDMQGIIDIAVAGAKLVRELTEADAGSGTNYRYEYSPESFSGTEMDFAVDICHQVMETLGATKENPVILNLPNTVEMCTPNTYADQIEYFIRHLPNREAAIISVHPHNDRGTGVACTELSLLAGAERVEGTLFGNGERTGNLDIVTVALNMFTQGVDPELDFSHIDHVRDIYERCTKMHVGALALCGQAGVHRLLRLPSGRDQQGSRVHARIEVPVLGDPVSAHRSGGRGPRVRAGHPHQQPVRQGRRGVHHGPQLRLPPAQADASGVRRGRSGRVRQDGPRAAA